jgi:hypothetical protein
VNLDVTADAIADTFARYRLAVNLNVAAAELGIEPEDLLRELGGLADELAPLGVGSAIKRDVWDVQFANAVCELNLGITDSEACGDVEEEEEVVESGESTGG